MKIIECPRDAMQGINDFIPTDVKIQYLNQLLKVGFDTLDFGSFVSPKAIPQMRDTSEVLKNLKLDDTTTKLLAIVANARGAEEASKFSQITYLGYPFSVSETFQKRNTHQSIEEAFDVVKKINGICNENEKKIVCYLSMGFGNPYGDPYDEEIVGDYIERLKLIGIEIFSLSDTIGSASSSLIYKLFTSLSKRFPDVELGVHLHSSPQLTKDKIKAAYKSGCKRYDGALRGFGGCPMAKDELVGNIATELIMEVLEEENEKIEINKNDFISALEMAQEIFSTYS